MPNDEAIQVQPPTLAKLVALAVWPVAFVVTVVFAKVTTAVV
jgi:hypothetical protein